MPDDKQTWLDQLKAHFKSKPKASPKGPPKAPPSMGPAKSVGPFAPVLKKAEEAVKKANPAPPRYKRLGEK